MGKSRLDELHPSDQPVPAGTINFKILKRTADFNLSNQDKLAAPTVQIKPLPSRRGASCS
jgi:hypothetical protein